MGRPYKFSRHAMYVEIEKFFKEENREGKCLFVGESRKFHKVSEIYHMFSDDSERVITHYPEVDIQSTPYEDESFDYVITDQVFEHVRNPWIAIDEIRRILKPDGWLILTTCLMMHVHMFPDDYWRFTTEGLKVLCEKFSNIAQCDAMGSYKVMKMCEEGHRGEPVLPNTALEKVAMSKDDKYWTHVWIIAQK
jgi:SAM-dependent methyltransferase